MRRNASALGLLALLLTGCGRLGQQQDTLAPHVAPATPPVSASVSAAVSSTASTASPAPSSAVVSDGRAGEAVASSQPLTAPAGLPCRADGQALPIAAPGGTQAAVAAGCGQEARTSQPAPPTTPPSTASASGPGASGAAAAPTSSAARSASASVANASSAAPSAIHVAPTASRALLQPMQHEYETWNNCAPVTSEMVLSYYGILKRQTEIAPVLRPHPKNFSVRMDQISAYLGQFGLSSQPLIGGTLTQLKALVSNDIPVVVEDQLSLQEDYGHFRVVRGFDDGAGVIIFGDSYYGPTNRLNYGLYQELWKRHNFAFMPVYKPEQASLVQAILGGALDPAKNQEQALNDARQAAAARPDDGFAWLNLGNDLYRSGQLPDAKAAWERAKQLQLTGRTLWYTIWPAAVYNRMGEFQRALDVVAIPLATDPDNAEALLERGNAFKGLGSKDKARADYAHAAEVDPSLLPARQALQALDAA